MPELLENPVEAEDRYPLEKKRDVRLDNYSHGYESPVDQVTGIPLSILPIENRKQYPNTFQDYHHLNYPRLQLLNGSDADEALRYSRGQDLERWLHERAHRFLAGPAFPRARSQMFTSIVLACAKVVPRAAIDLTDDRTPVVRYDLTDEEYLSVVRTIRHEGEQAGDRGRFFRNRIGIFFANYALEQSIDQLVSRRVIDEFLLTKDGARRKTLGNLMIREAVAMSLEPVLPVHKQLRQNGLIQRRPTDLRALVADYFVRSRRPDYFLALKQKLITV